jgi:hypothetical protein
MEDGPAIVLSAVKTKNSSASSQHLYNKATSRGKTWKEIEEEEGSRAAQEMRTAEHIQVVQRQCTSKSRAGAVHIQEEGSRRERKRCLCTYPVTLQREGGGAVNQSAEMREDQRRAGGANQGRESVEKRKGGSNRGKKRVEEMGFDLAGYVGA